jgi:putative endonuclease
MNERLYHVYMLASRSRVLYIGVTSKLLSRVNEHREGSVPGFSSRYRIQRLVRLETFGDVRTAINREKEIKAWRRARKVALIEESGVEGFGGSFASQDLAESRSLASLGMASLVS